jgi:nitrile hydratase
MDGAHDLGGRQGFGSVDVAEPEEPFHADWEARVWGIVRCMSRPKDWNSDWFRHCRELIDPVDYLTRPYYDQWLQAYAAMLVNSGIATVAEIASGRSNGMPTGLMPPLRPEALARASRVVDHYHRDTGAVPRFSPGAMVRARRHGAPGHTRLPLYVRGHPGEIMAFRGVHLLPDANAHGRPEAEPIYSVRFATATLWPEAAGRRDHIFLDMWESYLEPA